MKQENNEEDLFSAGQSVSTGFAVLGHKADRNRESRNTALRLRKTRIKSLCIAATCVLFGLLTACNSGPSKETNVNLNNLTLSSGSLLPVFAADTTAYSTYIANSTDSITVTPTTSSSKAKCDVRCDGGSWGEVISGSPCPSLTMNVGTNTVDVRVTAEDGTTTKTYTIAVQRVGEDVLIVPEDYSTIQAAIDTTAEGDTVLVREGTYVENIVLPTDRSITVRSTHGPESTIIDGDGNGPVVTFPASVLTGVVLDGFTITNGDNTNTSSGGGEIDILQSSPTITNCIISGNSSMAGGGGM